MPFNIFEGLNLNFDAWIYTELSDKERQSFFQFYDQFFTGLEKYARKKNDKVWKLLTANKRKDEALTTEVIKIPKPLKFEPTPTEIDDFGDTAFGLLMETPTTTPRPQVRTKNQPRPTIFDDIDKPPLAVGNQEMVETRDWEKSGKFFYSLRNHAELELPDKWTMLRFMEADNFKVSLSLKRLFETTVWRFENRVNTMLEDGFPQSWDEYQDHRVLRQVGVDFKGQPIMAERFGETLAVNNLSLMKLDVWMRCIIFETEQMLLELRRRSAEEGRPIHRVINIYDMENFSLWKALGNLKFLRHLSNTLSPNYPELVDKIIVVNAPTAVNWAYNKFVKKFLDRSTTDKVRIHDKIIIKKKVTVRKERKKRSRKTKSMKTQKTIARSNVSSQQYSPSPPPPPGKLRRGSTRSKSTFKSIRSFMSRRTKGSTATRYVIKKINTNMFEDICELNQLPTDYGGQNTFGVPFPHRLDFRSDRQIEYADTGALHSRGSRFSSSVFSALSGFASMGRRSKRTSRGISYRKISTNSDRVMMPRGSVSAVSVNTDHL